MAVTPRLAGLSARTTSGAGDPTPTLTVAPPPSPSTVVFAPSPASVSLWFGPYPFPPPAFESLLLPSRGLLTDSIPPFVRRSQPLHVHSIAALVYLSSRTMVACAQWGRGAPPPQPLLLRGSVWCRCLVFSLRCPTFSAARVLHIVLIYFCLCSQFRFHIFVLGCSWCRLGSSRSASPFLCPASLVQRFSPPLFTFV